MIVLDTNVLSALMRLQSEPAVVAWLNTQQPQSIWTTAVSVFEIQFGLATMPAGKRHDALEAAFEAVVNQDLNGRVLDFDTTAASETAALAAKLQRFGRPIEMRDAMIAGIVSAHGAALATRNIKHSTDTRIQLVDPWQGGPTVTP